MSGKHRRDGGEGFSVRGRSNQGVPEGHKPETERESDLAPYDPELAQRHAEAHRRNQAGR